MTIDEHLKKFRAVSVPPQLRSRVLAAGLRPARGRPWLWAAALVVVAGLTIVANAHLEERVNRQLAAAPSRDSDAAGSPGDASAFSVGAVLGRHVSGKASSGPTWAELRRQGFSGRT